jgi:hypothetical protein
MEISTVYRISEIYATVYPSWDLKLLRQVGDSSRMMPTPAIIV